MAIKADSKPGALTPFAGFVEGLWEDPVARFAIKAAGVGVVVAIVLVAVVFSPWIRHLPLGAQASLFQVMIALWPAAALFMAPDSWTDMGQLFLLVSAATALNALLYGVLGFAARVFWLRMQWARSQGAPPAKARRRS
jgi:hypothetical protein